MAKILLTDRLGSWFSHLGTLFQNVMGTASAEPLDLPITRLSNVELAEVMNQRWNLNSALLSGDDMVKFSFFQAGLDAGKSVCCLTRRLTQDDVLDKLLEAVTEEAVRGETRLRGLLLANYGVDPVDDDPAQFKATAPTVDLPYASGFLVGGDYLLTNRHVVEQQELLKEFRAVFGYEAAGRQGNSDRDLLNQAPQYEFDPNFWVASAPDSPLDYVLLKLMPLNGQSVQVNFKPLDLRPVANSLNGLVAPSCTQQNLNNNLDLRTILDPGLATCIEQQSLVTGDPIHMIQHPGGRPKEIVVFNNRLVDEYTDFLEYATDAEPGSSGSPLFNTDWQVVGLHQAARLDEEKLQLMPPQQAIISYLGIRMDRIVANLRSQPENHANYIELQQFLELYVNPDRSYADPYRVFILAGRSRIFLGKDNVDLERAAMLNLRQALNDALLALNPEIAVVNVNENAKNTAGEALKLAIQEINQACSANQYQSNVAIELLTNRSNSPSKNHGIALFYSAANAHAEAVAMALQTALKAFAQTGSPLPYIGAFPDTYTSTQQLRFCRNVHVPAVVIYVGYLDNESDRAYLEALRTDLTPALATSLAEGLLNSLQDSQN